MTSDTKWTDFTIAICPGPRLVHNVQIADMEILFQNFVVLFHYPESTTDGGTFLFLFSNLRVEFENRSDHCAITISITKTEYLCIVFSRFQYPYCTKSLCLSVFPLLFRPLCLAVEHFHFVWPSFGSFWHSYRMQGIDT